MGVSSLEWQFDLLWDSLFPDVDLEAEYRAIPGRRFKFDYAHLESRVLIEVNGQIHQKGGHSSGAGLLRDYEKLNLAHSLNYVVFQLAGEMITDDWLKLIEQTIRNRKLWLKKGNTRQEKSIKRKKR